MITAPLGPLRVAAGAGTGKTTTLAHRVGSLMVDHSLEPEEVLGITFTNKAAEELTDRIREILADRVDPGREVGVHTYHGFAASLLREFGALVGMERDTPVITPAFTRQILSGLLRQVPFRRFDPTSPNAVERLRRLDAMASDNLRAPADILEMVDESEVSAERAEMATVLVHYEQEKRRIGVCDYGDLIRVAYQLVTRNLQVADIVQERYRAVLCDEYQDTNPAQRELLRALFSGRVPVIAVGDEDQTIYEWRGASLENFRGFCLHFPTPDGDPAPSLPLTRNRRSGPQILEVANRIRGRIDDAPRALLRALDDAPPATVRTGWFETAAAEADWIARRVLTALGEGRQYRDVAVLFRKNKDMLTVHEALSRHGIPFEVANLGGLLTVPEVADLHSWLRMLGRPEDGPALARVLLGPRYRLGLGDLAHLSRWVRARRPELDISDDRLVAVPDFTLLEAIDHLDELDQLRPGALDALSQFRDEYRRLLVLAQGLSLVELCRSVLDVTDAWGNLEAMEEAAALSARLNLYRFLDLAESWSPLDGRPSLDAFLAHLDALAEESPEELDTARLSGSNAVTLITVHRAKGLEWPVVILPAVYRGNFPAHGTFDDPYGTAASLPYELRIDAESLPPLRSDMSERERKDLLRGRRDAQEWRIAYVAVTRAQHELCITGAHWYGHPQPTKTPQKPSDLWTLVDELDVSSRIGPWPDVPPRPETLGFRSNLVPPPDPLVEGSWPEALRLTLADPTWPRFRATELELEAAYDAAVGEMQEMLFRLPEEPDLARVRRVETSATGLVAYAQCPRRYYWSEVDRLPRRVGPGARRGIEVHRRIELHHQGVAPMEELSLDLYDTTPDEAAPPSGGPDPYEVFTSSRFAEERPILIEAPFELRLPADVWVRGRIDAVYDHGDRWEVVDFKSGRPTDDQAVIVQLETYAVAVREVPFGVETPSEVDVTFAYLGGGELVEETHHADPGWTRQAATHLTQLAEGIIAERFDPTPSEACHRCDFLRFCPAGQAFTAS